ncbi:CheY-like superfamily protein, partial [Tribonema minus]
ALVIDDTGSVRKLLCKVLESKGLRCDVARNGLEGLQTMRTRRYSVVLCDAFMPVMSGMECIQRFRQWEGVHRAEQPRQFIVGISSYLEGFDRDSGAIDAFLSKPIDLKWL